MPLTCVYYIVHVTAYGINPSSPVAYRLCTSHRNVHVRIPQFLSVNAALQAFLNNCSLFCLRLAVYTCPNVAWEKLYPTLISTSTEVQAVRACILLKKSHFAYRIVIVLPCPLFLCVIAVCSWCLPG